MHRASKPLSAGKALGCDGASARKHSVCLHERDGAEQHFAFGDLAVEGAIEEVENNEEYSEEYESEFDVQTVLESMLRTVMAHVCRRFDTKNADKLISHIRKQARIFHLVGDDGAHLLMSDLAERMKKRGADPSDVAILSKMNELAEGAPEQEQDLIDQFVKDQERQ